jgi:hypothetical protein
MAMDSEQVSDWKKTVMKCLEALIPVVPGETEK